MRGGKDGTTFEGRVSRNGTEFAKGFQMFRWSRRRVRASGPLGRRVAVRRGTRVGVGGRRVSAGGGCGFAAVAAGEGPRAKGGDLAEGDALDDTLGAWASAIRDA